MITLQFHLQPHYKYELFHIYFTSLHCTGRYELNKLTLLPMCGFIAQLVEHRTGIAEVTGSNPVKALIFFRLILSSCLKWKIYCDDHTSVSVVPLLHPQIAAFFYLESRNFLKVSHIFRDLLTTIKLYRFFRKSLRLPLNGYICRISVTVVRAGAAER